MAEYWYVCGPTVYDSTHLGHARTYTTVDIARRLAGRRRPIVLTMNITDVDDKIIARAAEQSVSPQTIAHQYEAAFWSSMSALGVEPPAVVGRVTESIHDMVAAIQRMLLDGHAYQLSNGSVHYSSKRKAVPVGTIIPEKRCPEDFALWKAAEGPGTFPSPWGQGRPGWHLECAVLIPKLLGGAVPDLDLHWGGIDLKFPHHCNEKLIRTAIDAVAPPWRFEHVGHLHIDGLKMSKSLKNFITVKDVLKRFTADELRLTFARHSYNTTMSWSDAAVIESRTMLRRFAALRCSAKAGCIRTRPLARADDDAATKLAVAQQKWDQCEHIKDLPKVIAVLGALPASVQGSAVEAQASRLIDSVLTTIGIAPAHHDGAQLLDAIHQIRADLRAAKQYELSDRIRDVYLPQAGVHNVSDATSSE